ncbi:MAG: HAD-IC family P-type ATPase [Verrucomicrobia bacterium]|nr:HAD-IC family P-type ATPase [Verrucomicrobiota bacterium]
MVQSESPGDIGNHWYGLDRDRVVGLLDLKPECGLTNEEAKFRLEKHGPNELVVKKGRSPLIMFLIQFKNPLLYILLIAGVVKAFLESWIEAGVIWAAAGLNALIAFTQEAKAENAITSLASSVMTKATVRRNGKMIQLASRELVPGDVVLLVSGDKVPADIRLLRSRNLQVNESALTGESVAVEKRADGDPLPEDTPLAERINMAYAGSFVSYGQGEGVVVATGLQTETGRISKLMEESGGLATPLTRKFEQFGRTILYVILGIASATFAKGLLWGDSPVYMFDAAVALAVSAIPEGLPAVVTITLAIGVSRMARRNAIVRNLPAVETLGSTTVICSDKTGTLTENQMTVQAIYAGDHHYSLTGDGYAPRGELRDGEERPIKPGHMDAPLRKCLLSGVLCNDSELENEKGLWKIVGDPTEGALLVSGRKAGLEQADLVKTHPRLDSIPFESDYQYMATLNRKGDTTWIYMKGSVESVVKRGEYKMAEDGTLHLLDANAIFLQAERMAMRGLRVLAFACKQVNQEKIDHVDLENGMIFLGLQGMIDPPRAEAIEAVASFHSAGVAVKMITGDHKVTAEAIAERMDLDRHKKAKAFTGQELAKLSSADLTKAADTSSVFARVAPEQKLRLVEALQSMGHIVAMTGDGVNDAPALKQADIGIAMGITGTEVAKEASDMVLTDDNFASIRAAVEEGRNVFQNLMKALAFLLSVNGGLSSSIFLSVMTGRGSALPILPLQVLWINMIVSVTMTIPLAFEPKSHNLMQRSPRSPDAPLLSRSLLCRILLVSVLNLGLIFGVFAWIQYSLGDLALARTMAIQTLVFGLFLYLFSLSQCWASLLARLRGSKIPIGNASALGFGIFAAIVLQIVFNQWGMMNTLFSTTPMNALQWISCLGISLAMIPVALLANRLDPRS